MSLLKKYLISNEIKKKKLINFKVFTFRNCIVIFQNQNKYDTYIVIQILSFLLSVHVRKGLSDGIDKASRDNSVKAVVVIGKGTTFIAGADIREFNKPPQGTSLFVFTINMKFDTGM